MHYVNSKLTGFFDANKTAVEVDGKYPDCQRIIVDLPNRSEIGELIENVVTNNKGLDCYKFNGVGYQKQYIDQAINGMESENIQVLSGDTFQAVRLSDGMRNAVVMPMRL